jgi:DNA-binding IclR family transcriptional regulator
MSLQIDVLRALLRLARRRTAPTLEQLVVRVGGEEDDVRRALGSLAKSGLVHRTPAGLRLSLPGFAVAVACADRSRAPAGRPGTTVRAADPAAAPPVRRRPAA